MPSKLPPQKRLKLIKRVLDGEEVEKVCKEVGISRVVFYRWLGRYKKEGKKGLIPAQPGRPVNEKPQPSKISYTKLSPNARLLMVKEVVDQNQEASGVAKKFNVSRVTLYKWINRYRSDLKVNKEPDLSSRIPHHDHYFNETPEKYQKAVLAMVAQHPEYGIRSIVANLPKIGERSIVGHHGVQNILRRYNLLRYEERVSYARLQITPITIFVSKLIRSFSSLFKASSEVRRKAIVFIGGTFLGAFAFILLIGLSQFLDNTGFLVPGISRIGLTFSLIALVSGSLFFLYSLKYYLTLAVVLSYSRTGESERSSGNLIARILGSSKIKRGSGGKGSPGLESDVSRIILKDYPLISVHIPFYNEKNVVRRSIEAAANFKYPSYEIILCDDSTDETTSIISAYMKDYLRPGEKLGEIRNDTEGWIMKYIDIKPGITLKHLHRFSRQGYKGKALDLALRLTDERAKYITVFDADFIPYADTLQLFLKYFKAGEENKKLDGHLAAVQGYQWHVLNKSENWITRGVRSEYAGSYVIERSGLEIYGGLKQISGSVYMIRRDILQGIGWGSSITEDFELTLRLYAQGYKVLYTPYVQAPAECVSTLRRLARQRMRWAEGHSFNIKKMFPKIIFSHNLSLAEKIEFLYLSPYYLQAFFFLLGTISWLVSESVFRARLPFWTETWGWSLVLTNMFALPLMNSVGLFLEESEERDFLGIMSFLALSYLLVPFQAYSAVKGFLEPREGGWFRTPKTGRVTDVFTKGTLYRLLQGILPGRVGVVQENVLARYLALATANNKFNSFSIKKKSNRWLGKVVLTALLIISLTTYSLTRGIPEVLATNPTTPFVLSSTTSSVLTGTTSWKLLDNTTATTNSTTILSVANKGIVPSWFLYAPGKTTSTAISGTACPSAASGTGWVFDTPFGGSGGHIATGTWTFYYNLTDNGSAYTGYLEYCVYAVSISGGSVGSSRLLYDSSTDVTPPSTDVWIGGTSNSSYTTSSIAQTTMTFNAGEYLYVDYYNDQTVTTTSGKSTSYTSTMNIGGSSVSTSMRIATPAVTIPEKVVYLWPLALFVPFLSGLIGKRRETI